MNIDTDKLEREDNPMNGTTTIRDPLNPDAWISSDTVVGVAR